ncbi:MAG: DUF302 domain-containing protein [Rhodobacteraceae bacterium]|nr:DUF302 domain-containing protein [Paracoccaceae bacterium]
METAQTQTVQQNVDSNFALAIEAVEEAGLVEIASIDHSRLAMAEGAEMPASRVLIYSDRGINSAILSENVRAGLDLPFRVLSYDDGGEAQVSFTDAEFLKVRHGLEDETALAAFADLQTRVFDELPAQPAPVADLSLNYGIIELRSDLNVTDAVKSLTETVRSQSDTVWFGEVNFAAEAAEINVAIDEAVLLLFGGPAPGGVAMAGFPAIGLDAFCQKLLVISDGSGGSVVLFNDIAALAELHYGDSAKPHHMLNERLTETFRNAL